MNEIVVNIALIFGFIAIGGVFAAAEMALVSLRDSQIRSLSHRGGRGKTIAKLTADPNRFLSAVQVGVTLSGFLSAALGGATLSDRLAPVLARLGPPLAVAHTVALVLITVAISYFSIVLGELTAKRLALQRSEQFAIALAPMVDFIATLARPVIWLLGVSTNLAVRVFGGDPTAAKEEVSDEELRAMVSVSSTLGAEERRIVDDVFAAGHRGLREVMVPRTEVDFLPGAMTIADALIQVANAPHSRYPVTGDSADDIVGFIHVRDLFGPHAADRQRTLRGLVRPVVSLPGTVKVLRALSDLRSAGAHLAIVLDEYGGTAGIVTLEDLVEELVGEISDEYDPVPVVRGEDRPDSFDADGLLSLEEFAERSGRLLPEGHYDTLAGFVMAELGEVPQKGSNVIVTLQPDLSQPDRRDRGGDDEEQGHDEPREESWQFEVTELDGRRAARLHVHRLDPGPTIPAQEVSDRPS